MLKWMGTIALLLVAAWILLWPYIPEPQKLTFAESRDRIYVQCHADKGAPDWRGSSGISLEDFCKARANTRMRMEFCAENPEKC